MVGKGKRFQQGSWNILPAFHFTCKRPACMRTAQPPVFLRSTDAVSSHLHLSFVTLLDDGPTLHLKPPGVMWGRGCCRNRILHGRMHGTMEEVSAQPCSHPNPCTSCPDSRSPPNSCLLLGCPPLVVICEQGS